MNRDNHHIKKGFIHHIAPTMSHYITFSYICFGSELVYAILYSLLCAHTFNPEK